MKTSIEDFARKKNQKGKHLMKTKILRNISISVGVLFAFTRLLTAGTSERLSNFNSILLVPPHPTFITFDVPAAVYGTVPIGINPAGTIAGYYIDTAPPFGYTFHGFLRTRDGTISTFDAPGGVNGTLPGGATVNEGGPCIDPAGAITGTYLDASNVYHGFLRARNGTFTTFDVPGAVNGTNGQAINPNGAIMGYHFEASGGAHGFLRDRDGTFTTFDAPGAVFGTVPLGFNPEGTITGYYTDALGFFGPIDHGFLRTADGTFAAFDPPRSIETHANAINAAGAITGYYVDLNFPFSFLPFRGFLRAPDGTLTTFDAPDAGRGFEAGTIAVGINPAGTVTGYYIPDFPPVVHGFLRAADGTVTEFDVPGASSTAAAAINPAGLITGSYLDANGVHGFLRIP
jgi:uncharacterized membrane protein